MGWQQQPDDNYWMSFPAGETFKLHALIATWKPSESIETAMQVVDQMRERGHEVRICGAAGWSVTFEPESRRRATSGGPSLPDVICRAALAAIERS
jgi:hypothetical protein